MKIIAERHKKTRRQGAALIMVFWLIALLTLMIFTTVRIVRNDADIMISQKKAFRATQLAEMGIAIGANPSTKETDVALLSQELEQGEGFRVKLKGEGGKFNINTIIQGQDRDLLKTMFEYWGLEEENAATVVDSLIDWVDGDDLEQLNGAESRWYEEQVGALNYPFNRAFYSLDEMALVRGMDEVILFQPRWRDFFTIYSNGRLDLNEADAEHIALAVAGDADEVDTLIEEANELIEMRWGLDGIEDTEDDERFSSVGTVLAMMGRSPQEEVFVNRRVTLEDSTTRVESIGYIGGYQKKIVVVVRDRSRRPQILTREEVPLF